MKIKNISIKFNIKHITIFKIASFFSSMLPFSIYMIIMYFKDDYKFWGIKYLTPNLGAILALTLSIISTIYLLVFFKVILKNLDYSKETIKVKKANVDKANTTNYILANVLPIVSLSMDNEYKSLYVIFIIFLLGKMYIKNELYSTNPAYDFMNIYVYQAEISIIDDDNIKNIPQENEGIVFSIGKMKNIRSSEFKVIHYSDSYFIIETIN